MSLSQKTLELDTIIVDTLFNRGVPLSTSQAYMPIVSYLGTYVPPPPTRIQTYTQQEVVIETSYLENVTTLAGGTGGYNDGTGTNARFNNPFGITCDSSNIYVADTLNNRIRKITPGGVVTTLAGGTSGYNDGTGTNALFNYPYGITCDSSNIYVADSANNRIRKITPGGVVTTVAGGTSGYNDGTGTNALFNNPNGITCDSSNIYVADSFNNLIRKINTISQNSYTYETVTVSCNVYDPISQCTTCPCTPWSAPIRGNMLMWSNLPISTIYDSFFYGVNPADLLNKILLYETEENSISTTLQYCVDTVISLSNTTLNTFVTLCNINSRIISSYSSNLLYDTALVIQRSTTINQTYEKSSTLTGIILTTFFTGIFASNATTLFELGDYYYTQRPIILPVPVPWYWQGNPPRFVGPGLSSIYISTQSNIPLITSYMATLSNTSTSWGNSNTHIQGGIESYYRYTNTLIQTIDSGSSISTLFYNSNSSFIGNLSTQFYGDDVSTISTFVTEYFTTYPILTDGPYISTGASSMFNMNSTLNSTLLSYISSGTLGDPLSTFSTIVDFQLTLLSNDAYTQANIATLSTLNSTLLTSVVPIMDLLSLSTNYAGYQSLSSLYPILFSSVSTFYTSYFDSNLLQNASTLYSTSLAFSSILNGQTSSILGLNSQLNAGPGASSLSLYLSTNISTSYTSYSAQVSSLSTFLQYSTTIFQNQLKVATSYYAAIKPMLYYSTSRYVYPGTGNTSQYLLRSTSFTAIELRSTMNISSLSVSTLGVRATGAYSFAINGAVNILQSAVNQNQPSLLLSNFTVYASDTIGITPGNTLVAQLSSIVFNSTFTIKRLYNSTLSGLIGINTTTPAYALDIGAGDARKLTGANWITPSDERIKENIGSVNYDSILQEISSLRLVSYTWAEPYRVAHGLTTKDTLGFISQEVEHIFPRAVTTMVEEGFYDFRSLDIDQLMKAKFAVTQHLLSRFSTLQIRINNLM